LYEKYRDRVQFVIIDLDKNRSKQQQELVKKYFTGSIPHIVVLDPKGDPIYNRAGEVDSGKISDLLDKQLQ
jgi:thioredoxin-related protein